MVALRSVLGLLVVALLASGCGPAALPASAPSQILEQPLPKFKRRALDGSTIDIGEAAGKVVVVKFFAKYCEPCVRTLPAAERLHQQASDMILIGVAEDEYQADAEEIVKTYGLSFPVIHDKAQILAGRFRVSQLPATFVADSAGRVRWVGGPQQQEGDLGDAVGWISRQGQ